MQAASSREVGPAGAQSLSRRRGRGPPAASRAWQTLKAMPRQHVYWLRPRTESRMRAVHTRWQRAAGSQGQMAARSVLAVRGREPQEHRACSSTRQRASLPDMRQERPWPSCRQAQHQAAQSPPATVALPGVEAAAAVLLPGVAAAAEPVAHRAAGPVLRSMPVSASAPLPLWLDAPTCTTVPCGSGLAGTPCRPDRSQALRGRRGRQPRRRTRAPAFH
mmetsp:Transcript_29884/g.96443  ORF Transcript_29884/g.96443 Transcript_29884/m.96443 type:complete len:219 (-) Transcript_29884:263-919(-)